nr:ribonuclease H-like domain-containing protein [Tanacetum cinerariifolium]
MTTKLPILNPWEYDLSLMRIEQYFLMTDYSLWKVIKNGNKVLTKPVGSSEQTYEPTTAEEKQDKRNEMKVKGTLLMALPNKDQLKMQKLISQLELQGEVIQQEDINLKLLSSLPSEWKNHALIWRNKAELETISLDDLYNNLKIYEPKISRSSNTNQSPQNMDFVSSQSTSSTNEVDTTASGDLKQIDLDDLKETDLHWEMAMLTIRARRFMKRTKKSLDMNGQRISFDKIKVECFNCHKNGHFSREYRAPRNQDNTCRDYGRTSVPVETPTENALIAQDGIGGYDWSYQAEENTTTNYAFMAFISSGSSSSSDSEGNPHQKKYKEKGVIDSEAVNTACYVLNKALVTKPHNKTPYELIRERPPLIDFMKPFGCPVTILNTKDNLGKFEGKADEGYFIGPDWLFDIDSLTISMNYVQVVTGNQTNGIAGTKEKLVVAAKDSVEDARKTAPAVDAGKASDNGGHNNQVSRSEDGSLFQQDRQTEHNNSTNDINIVSLPVSTAGPSFVNAALQIPLNNVSSLPHVPMVTPIDDTGIFGNAYDDDVLKEEVDMNNVDSSYAIPKATKFLKDHPQEQRVSRHIKGQPKLGLWYPKDSPFDLEAYSDSDYAGASPERKSTTGGCHFLGKRLVIAKDGRCFVDTSEVTTGNTLLSTAGLTTVGQRVNDQEQIQALVDKKKVTITEDSIRSDLRFDDAEGTACLLNEAIFKGLACMRRKQRKEAEVSQDESEDEDHVPTHSSDQVPSEAKDAQSKEVTALKKKVSKLLKWRKSRSRGLKRLMKVDSGRMIKEIDQDDEILLDADAQGRKNDDEMFRVDDLPGEEVVLDTTTEQEVSTTIPAAATIVTTVVPTPRAKGIAFHEQKQLHIPIVSSSKDKGKAKMIEHEVPIKKKDQMRMDKEEMRKVNVFIAIDSKAQKSSGKEAQESSTKRIAESLESDISKKQKVNANVKPVIDDTEELKKCMEIVPDDGDEVLIEATPISSRSLTIIDYKIHKEEKKNYLKIIRADVKDRFKKEKPVDDMDNLLVRTLKTMFKHHVEDTIWTYQQGLSKVKNWKLFESCGVYCITMKSTIYYLLVEKPSMSSVPLHIPNSMSCMHIKEIPIPATILPLSPVLSLSPMFDSRHFFPPEKISPSKDAETPVESPIQISPSSSVGSTSPITLITPPPDYPFDESIFTELDNSLWIIPRLLGSKPVLEEPIASYAHLWK